MGTAVVTYTATDNNANVTSSNFSVTVIDASTTTVTTSGSPVIYGNSLTFTAAVSACSATPPTGTVTFKDWNGTLGTVPLGGSSQATLISTNLHAGWRHITAVYPGDSYYTPSTSSVLAQHVQPATLTVSGSANNKIYDGGTVATLNFGSAALVGVVPGDTVLLNTAGPPLAVSLTRLWPPINR